MKAEEITLGHVYTDSVTGFTGVAVAIMHDLGGNSRTELQPESRVADKLTDSKWFFTERLTEAEA